MKLRPKTNILLLILAVCIVSLPLYTEISIAAAHDCCADGNNDYIDKHCLACLLVKAGKNFLRTLLPASFGFYLVFLAFFRQFSRLLTGFHSISPITLKVRINT